MNNEANRVSKKIEKFKIDKDEQNMEPIWMNENIRKQIKIR